MPILSLTGTRPTDLGPVEGRLRPCPPSPNAVCSDDPDESRRATPLLIVPGTEPVAAWSAALEAVATWPRTEIVTATDEYAHVECQSAIFGFVDDLELHLRPGEGMIAVRSASRLGHSDLGANRRRVERLRAALAGRGVIRPAS